MSEEKKESEVKEKSEDNSTSVENKSTTESNKTQEASPSVSNTVLDADTAIKAAEEAELAARAAIAKAEELKIAAEKAAEAEYKEIAKEVKSEAAKAPEYTFKRQGEYIFRREMDEPEFFLDKKDRFPVPILTAEQQEVLTRKAEIPVDNTPEYMPENMLSPEYGGVSNYESGVGNFLEETRQRLATLKKDPNATEKEINQAENDLTYLESLHENYYLGMNVFRTAKGGRNKSSK